MEGFVPGDQEQREGSDRFGLDDEEDFSKEIFGIEGVVDI